MRKTLGILMLGLLVILQSGCINQGGNMKGDLKTLVDEIGRQSEEAFLAGDVDKLLEYYCDDVVSMPNFHEMVKGKDNLRHMLEAIKLTGMKFESLDSITLEAHGSGNLVYEIGTFSQSVIMPGSDKPQKSEGKYLTVWRKESDGKLRIAVEIYNSNEMPVK